MKFVKALTQAAQARNFTPSAIEALQALYEDESNPNRATSICAQWHEFDAATIAEYYAWCYDARTHRTLIAEGMNDNAAYLRAIVTFIPAFVISIANDRYLVEVI